MLSACASRGTKPSPAEKPQPAPTAAAAAARPTSRAKMVEEPIPEGGSTARASEAAPPSAPPDPQMIVASIGPSTPPSRAASLRLTDEGRRLLESGDSTTALDRLEKAIKIDPTNPHAYYWLAQVHDHRGRMDQAVAFSDKAVVLYSTGDTVWLAQAYTFRASVLERSGRFPEARDSYRRAVRAEPGNVAARAGLARLGESGMPLSQ